MEKTKFALEDFSDTSKMYILNDKEITYLEQPETEEKDIALYHVEEISFDEKAPRKEALENVIATMRIPGISFVYLIVGDKNGVKFYYGIVKDNVITKNIVNISDIGQFILEPSLKGNFRGSKVSMLSPEEKSNVIDIISSMKYVGALEGVAGEVENAEKFQGVDRLADTMLGDKFCFMVIAKPITDDVFEIEKNLYEFYNGIAPLAKISTQKGDSSSKNSSTGTSTSHSDNNGTTITESTQQSETINSSNTTGDSFSEQKGTSHGTSEGGSSSSTNKGGSESTTKGTNHSHTDGKSDTNGKSTSTATSISKGTSKGLSNTESSGTSNSISTTAEIVNKCASEWLKYLDEIILPRLDYGKGKGIFVTSMFMLSENQLTLIKLENTAMSLFSGDAGNRIPLKPFRITDKNVIDGLKHFKMPYVRCNNNSSLLRSAYSQYSLRGKKYYAVGNWVTSNELSLIAGLPQKEIIGLSLKEEVEFGLNLPHAVNEENSITLGSLVKSGNEIDNIPVSIDRRNLDKHIFVTGVTGSGKTTTCQKILIDSKLPFLIIEPAKKEYRVLMNQFPDLLVFTLGKDTGTPFRLNPFQFLPHESITSRVDMIKASIEAAFDMEAAIPQLIESAIYECYKDYGWNISSNENMKFDDPFADDVNAFPTLSDLVAKIEIVVADQHFDDRLKNDYIGSIKARLLGLTVGSKGLMLNTHKSVNFREMLNKSVVFELEEIRNANEKALVMGFILMNLVEAIKAEYEENPKYRHITLVEEAHRLLSKYVPGDSLNKKQAVETFTDILAEIRKYGEGLIIADQIPNKLTPEILKNTNTKIIHKIFAQDDKEAVGNTIVLSKEQKEFLSNLDTGNAILFSNGFTHAVQVRIRAATNTTDENLITDEKIKNNVYNFYAANYKQSALIDSAVFSEKPDGEYLQRITRLCNCAVIGELISDFAKKGKVNSGYINKVEELKSIYSIKEIALSAAYKYCIKAENKCFTDRYKNGKFLNEVARFISVYNDNLGSKESICFKNIFISNEKD